MAMLAIAVGVVLSMAPLPARAAAEPSNPVLDRGFSEMYELRFQSARRIFRGYIREHPGDPMGQVSLAASYLFEEFNNHGVFTPSFFLDNKKLLGGIPHPGHDPAQAAFLQSNSRARQMAQAILKTHPNDRNSLFALTLADGMQSDYDALVAKRDLDCLVLLHEAEKTAASLLAIDPGADDAYLALGAAHYIIGCLPAYKRFFLSIGGIHGSRSLGMSQLEIAATRGHYLKPFAKVMLALASLREKQPERAHQLFVDLHAEFPENGVFASEVSRPQ
jgi:hypothetical protein